MGEKKTKKNKKMGVEISQENLEILKMKPDINDE